MSSSSSSSSTGEVIVNSPSPSIKNSCKKQISPAKRWCFTLNNYTEDEISSIVPILNEHCKKAIFSKEIGESGTPHLQGFLEFITKARPASKFEFTNRIHWELAKGNDEAQLKYITKENEVHYSKGFPKPVKIIEPTYWWQTELVDIVSKDPDDRTIHWYWSENGGVGKTAFCKYLTIKHDAIALSGKAQDMFHAIISYQEKNDRLPELIVIPLPRSFNCEFLSYTGIESVKDMYFFSGKYEGGQVCGNSPHVIVFANEPPDKSKMSKDRWNIVKID